LRIAEPGVDFFRDVNGSWLKTTRILKTWRGSAEF